MRREAALAARGLGTAITLAAAGRARAALCPAHPAWGALMTYPEPGSAEIIERACASTVAVLGCRWDRAGLHGGAAAQPRRRTLVPAQKVARPRLGGRRPQRRRD